MLRTMSITAAAAMMPVTIGRIRLRLFRFTRAARATPAPGKRGLRRFSVFGRQAVPQEVARDEPAMHFARTFIDAPGAAGAVHVFDRQVLGDAHAAEELDRPIGDP